MNTPTGPCVSIVLPTFNRARMLRGAVESCLNQTFRDIEVIIVDDHSPDDTEHIAREWAARDERVRYIRHEKNLGLPAALNTGFAASRGRFLTWTSDDNRYRPDAISRLVAALETRPSVHLVYSSFSIVDENGKFVRRVQAEDPRKLLLRNIVCASFMYRRETYRAIGDYDADLYTCEDYDYWLRIYSRFPIAAVAEDLYEYLSHDESLTVRRRQTYFGVKERMLQASLLRFHERGQKAMLLIQLAALYKELGRLDMSQSCLRQCLRLSPRVYFRWHILHNHLGPWKERFRKA